MFALLKDAKFAFRSTILTRKTAFPVIQIARFAQFLGAVSATQVITQTVSPACHAVKIVQAAPRTNAMDV